VLENLEELVQPRAKRARKEKKGKGEGDTVAEEDEFEMVAEEEEEEEEETMNGEEKRKGGKDELNHVNARSHGYCEFILPFILPLLKHIH